MQASIITPTFNAARFIEECIRNVEGQGSSVLEHLIADGGSTDGTVEIVKELQLHFPKVRLLSGPDRGQSDAMNKATNLAKGDVIGILNADDYYEPSVVSRALSILEKSTSPAFVCGDCNIIDQNGDVVYTNRPRDLRREALLQDSWLFPIPCNPSAYFYTKNVHDLVGGYDIEDNYAMDCAFVLLCAKLVKMIYVPETWGNFRMIPGSKTFEDNAGGSRVAKLIKLNKIDLTIGQRLNMLYIKIFKNAKYNVGRLLRRFGLLKRR